MTDAVRKGAKIFFKLFKFAFFAAVFFSVILIVLGNVGGNSPELKNMVEEYASDALGKPARVETLHQLRFFPVIMIDFEDLTVHETFDEKSPVVASIDRVQLGVDFFSAILGDGKVKHFVVEGASAQAGFLTDKQIRIESLRIVDDAPEADLAAVELRGALGDDELSASVTINAKGQGHRRIYSLAREQDISLTFADFQAQAQLSIPQSGHVNVADISVSQGKKNLLTGHMSIQSKLSGRHVAGDVIISNTSHIQPDLKIDSDNKITGRVVMPKVTPQDLAALPAVIAGLQNKIAPEKDGSKQDAKAIDLSALNMDVTLQADQVILNDQSIAQQEIKVTAKEGILKISAPKGTLAQGQSDLKVSLEPKDGQYVLNISFLADNMKVQNFIKDNAEEMDITLDSAAQLSADLKTWDDILPNLKGSWHAVSEQGSFEARWLNVWGDGLTSLILPSLKPSDEAQLNCALIGGNIDGGMNIFEPIYIDGQHVSIIGQGSYNLLADKLDVKIKPQTKDISFGDISAAVNVKGSISKPSIRPDALDTGKKAAGLLLGAVNPALLALTTTNLNIDLGQEDQIDYCAQLSALPDGNKASAYAQSK